MTNISTDQARSTNCTELQIQAKAIVHATLNN